MFFTIMKKNKLKEIWNDPKKFIGSNYKFYDYYKQAYDEWEKISDDENYKWTIVELKFTMV